MRLDTLYKRNTHPNIYKDSPSVVNCGSFALDVDTWYCPYLEDDSDLEEGVWQYTDSERRRFVYDLIEDGYSAEEIAEVLIEKDFEFILKTCSWLVPVKKEDITINDRAIAYRLSIMIPDDPADFDYDSDTDFHFCAFINGEWWEKNGESAVKKIGLKLDEEPWEVEDWLVYDGPIKFAKFR